MENTEVLYKNTSKMDASEISIFQSYAMKKINIISSIAFALVFAGIGTGACFWNLTCGIIVIVCGVLGGFVLLPYLMKDSIKKQNAQSYGDKKYLNTFEFCDEYVQITSEASALDKNEYQPIATQKLFYEDALQAVLYRDHLFLYISPRQAFILDYKGMTKGTIGEVIDMLKTKNIKVIDKTTK